MDQYWVSINDETYQRYIGNKWFQLLLLIPNRLIIDANSNIIEKIQYALLNDESFDLKSKKDIYRYVYSLATHSWNARRELTHMDIFECPQMFDDRYSTRLKQTKWMTIQNIVKLHETDKYNQWRDEWQRSRIREYNHLSWASNHKAAFSGSSIYQFIHSLDETDYGMITSANLFVRYQAYCQTNNLICITIRSFGRVLNEHGISTIRHTNGRSYRLTQENISTFIHWYDEQ